MCFVMSKVFGRFWFTCCAFMLIEANTTVSKSFTNIPLTTRTFTFIDNSRQMFKSFNGNNDFMFLVDHKTISFNFPLVKLSISSIKHLASPSLLRQQGSLNKTLFLQSNKHSGIISCSSHLLVLKSMITDFKKPMEYPACKYFYVIVWDFCIKTWSNFKSTMQVTSYVFLLISF